MTESETEHDEYLWRRSGPIDAEVAGLERELARLAWQPRSLPALPVSPVSSALPRMAHDAPALSVMIPLRAEPPRRREWSIGIAGLAMAAAVLSAIYLARPEPKSPTHEPAPVDSLPAIHPAAPPQENHRDLEDPFSSVRDSTAPSAPDLQDPFRRRREQTPPRDPQSDLKNPFSGRPARTRFNPTPTPAGGASSDLKDPFANPADKSSQSQSGTLVDPFSGTSSESPEPSQPDDVEASDLVDPFRRQH